MKVDCCYKSKELSWAKHGLRSLLFFFVFLIAIPAISQESRLLYLSPVPNALYVSSESTVVCRLKTPVLPYASDDFEFVVHGSESGIVSGGIVLGSDKKTIIFRPDRPFCRGEQVAVEIYFQSVRLVNYQFEISRTAKAHQLEILQRSITGEEIDENQNDMLSDKVGDDLPQGLPDITITHKNNPSPGYIFLATISNKSRSNEFLAIYDNAATPVFYRMLQGNTGADFKIQPNGNLSYYGRTHWEFYEMNPYFDVVDTIRAGNGYFADIHELILTENGHKFLMAYDVQLVDMSLIVPGGNPNASVTGLIIQELDINDEVIFEWRSWDHFAITDAADRINLLGSIIDYVHGNSIELDTDTTMIISSRNLDEVTRINRNTGQIIWRFGGKMNQFTLIDSTDLFCHQHDARLIPSSGNLSVFDNGNCHVPQYSSAVEFEMDYDNMTAREVSRLRSSPDIFGSYLGNAQRLENGHAVVGWGSGIPSITEFNTLGDIALQFSFNHINYRAFKFNWQSPILTSTHDTLAFGAILQHDSVTRQVSLTNNYHDTLTINEVYFDDPQYRLVDELPVNIVPAESAVFNLRFVPQDTGVICGFVTFAQDFISEDVAERKSHQVFVTGRSETGIGTYSESVSLTEVQVFPNPFIDRIHIESQNRHFSSVRIYSHTGWLVYEHIMSPVLEVDLSLPLPHGHYVMVISDGDHQLFRTKLVK